MKIEPEKINAIENKTEINKELTQKQREFKEACAGFESMFISQLLQQMRKNIPKSGFLGESKGQELVEGLMDDEYARYMATSGGIGLANLLYQQLKDTVE